ncbi:MAG: GGDEF domain-containing protein [Eubacterium sp.]|nr:GGDEF domain-containing protein [Eubacterium sp.]
MGIVSLINRDIAAENETKRVIVALRILLIVVFIAFTVDTLLAGPGAVQMYPYRIFGLLGANIFIFVLTYHSKTRTALWSFVLFLFLWTILMIPVYGWSAGMQNYYIIILMLTFFASHSSSLKKFIYAGFVLVFRILTILIYGGMNSEIVTSPFLNKCIQISNISAVFISIILISYIFSKKESDEENKLMKYNDRLKKEANTDRLTGLFNRRRAEEYLKQVTQDSESHAVSVAIGDIDFFKKVNDTYGHDVGDEVLKFVANKMRESCGSETFLARWGGEEFLLVFPNSNGDDAYIALEKLRNELEESEIKVKDIVIRLTMTFGLSEFSFNKGEKHTVKEADEKLYMGKANGRNQVVY